MQQKSVWQLIIKLSHLLTFVIGFGLPLLSQPPDQRGLTIKPRINQLPAANKRFALIIGIDEYSDPQISGLHGAQRDAQTLAEALVRYAGFPPEQVILLTNDAAPGRRPLRSVMLQRLSNLRGVVPKDGLLLVAFSGHGIERGGKAFLLPADAVAADDVALLEDTAISVERMRDSIRATGVRQVMLILDACRNDPTAGRSNAANLMTEAMRRGFDFSARNQGVEAFVTLYATAVGQRAYEYSEKQQGYFTWALIEGLKGAAANKKGEVTLGELKRYIENTVPQRVKLELGREQKPFAVIEGYKAEELVVALAASATATPTTAPPPTRSNLAPLLASAETALRYTKLPELMQATEAALRLAPNDPVAHWLRGDGYFRLSEAEQARQEAETVLRLVTQPQSDREFTARGWAHSALGKHDAAIQDLDQALRLNPQTFFAYLERGAAWAGKQDYERALADINQAVRLDGQSAYAFRVRADIYVSKKEYEQAIADFTAAIRLTPSAEALDGRCNAQVNQGKYAEAIADCTEAIRLNAKFGNAYVDRGNAYRLQANYPNAIADYTQAIRLNPKNAIALNNRGFTYTKQGNFEAALADLTEAIRLSPKLVVAYTNRGMTYNDKGEYEKAIADFTEAIRLEPGRGTTHFNRGNAYFNQGAVEKAIADYNVALQLNPQDAGAWNNRGYAYRRKGDDVNALADYTAAMRVDPSLVAAYNNRGELHRDKGNTEQALADFTEALRLNPKHLLAYFNRGGIYQTKRDFDRALADMTETIRLDPNHVGAHNQRGNAHYGRREFQLAIADYTEAIRLNPQEPVYYENRASAYKQLGRKELAAPDESKAKQLRGK